MFSYQKTNAFAFSYKEGAPAIWGHILNKAATYFRIEDSINRDYAEHYLLCDSCLPRQSR